MEQVPALSAGDARVYRRDRKRVDRVYAGYPEQWIRILGKRIKKVHFKDFRRNPGGLNSFVDILAGDVDWPAVMQAFEDIGYDGWATGEMIPAYGHASDQIIYNTAASMGRILEKKF